MINLPETPGWCFEYKVVVKWACPQQRRRGKTLFPGTRTVMGKAAPRAYSFGLSDGVSVRLFHEQPWFLCRYFFARRCKSWAMLLVIPAVKVFRARDAVLYSVWLEKRKCYLPKLAHVRLLQTPRPWLLGIDKLFFFFFLRGTELKMCNGFVVIWFKQKIIRDKIKIQRIIMCSSTSYRYSL